MAYSIVLGALAAAVSAGLTVADPGFLSYSSFAGAPYAVTYDNRLVLTACSAVDDAPDAVSPARWMANSISHVTTFLICYHCRRRSLFLNGRRSMFLSAGFHYPRFTPAQWDDIFVKAQNDGFNMIQVCYPRILIRCSPVWC